MPALKGPLPVSVVHVSQTVAYAPGSNIVIHR
jgi:hypothetical protein